VNPGGEPGRDDGGLPPADIEIPDDARELERDVLAYRRELRARRRRARWDRLLGPLRGHGALLPLVASCVALSMLAGTLLSVFSISPASAPVLSNSAAPSPRTSSSSSLPAGTVLINHRATSVRSLLPALLVLVSPGCNCAQAVKQVTAQARQAGVKKVYLVGTTGKMADVNQLVRAAGPAAVAVEDAGNVLVSAYRPAGLTIVLAKADATTSVRRNLQPGRFQLEDQLRQLGATAQGASPTPGSAVSVLPTPT
jgi:hypothetical protein